MVHATMVQRGGLCGKGQTESQVASIRQKTQRVQGYTEIIERQELLEFE